jgi:hypothetical protein
MPLFWEDISSDLCSKDEIARKWFPTLFAPSAAPGQVLPAAQSADAAYWEAMIQRMVSDWLNCCVNSRQLGLIEHVPIVRIARMGAKPVIGFPVLGRWDMRMVSFVPTHGNGGADTVRVNRTDVAAEYDHRLRRRHRRVPAARGVLALIRPTDAKGPLKRA